MKRITYLLPLMLLFCGISAFSQDCNVQLEEAKRQFYNGQFSNLESTLSGCIDNLGYSDKLEALRILTNSFLLTGNDEKADEYMNQLLNHDPYYKVTSADLQEFSKLYETYDLTPKMSYGIGLGFVYNDPEILLHHSYGSDADEPDDYTSRVGMYAGISLNYTLLPYLQVSSGIGLTELKYSTTESILDYRSISIDENSSYLSIPIGVSLTKSMGNFRHFVGGGINNQFLLYSRGDITHFGFISDDPLPGVGVTYTADNYDLGFQRRSYIPAWSVWAGSRYQLQEYMIELKFNFSYALANHVQESERYTDSELTDVYAFVPDDFHSRISQVSISILKNIVQPKKKDQ